MTGARNFFRVISVAFGALGGSFSRALDGFSNLRGVSQICGGIHSLSNLPLVDQVLLIPPLDGAPQLLIFVRFC